MLSAINNSYFSLFSLSLLKILFQSHEHLSHDIMNIVTWHHEIHTAHKDSSLEITGQSAHPLVLIHSASSHRNTLPGPSLGNTVTIWDEALYIVLYFYCCHSSEVYILLSGMHKTYSLVSMVLWSTPETTINSHSEVPFMTCIEHWQRQELIHAILSVYLIDKCVDSCFLHSLAERPENLLILLLLFVYFSYLFVILFV